MNKHLFKSLLLIIVFLNSCTPAETHEQTEQQNCKVENEDNSNDNSSDSKESKENTIDFRILSLDGWYPSPNYDDNDVANFRYTDIIETPIVIKSKSGIDYVKENYNGFYQEREKYLERKDFSNKKLFIFSFSKTTSNYYYFVPLFLSTKDSTLNIKYQLYGEDELQAGRLENPRYFTSILEISPLNETVQQINMSSESRTEPWSISSEILYI